MSGHSLPDSSGPALLQRTALAKATDLTIGQDLGCLVFVVSIDKRLLTAIDALILRNPNLMLFRESLPTPYIFYRINRSTTIR
jgi:hypothetical protein